MSIAALVRTLIDAGVDGDVIVAAVEAIEPSRVSDDVIARRRAADADRQARYRESKRNVTSRDTVTERDIPSQDKGPQTPKNSTLPTPKENPPKGGQKKGSALHPDWTADDKDLAYAAKKGLVEPRLSREIEKFRDHHLKIGSVFKDWNAAWRTWCNSDFLAPSLKPPVDENEPTGPPGPPPGAPTADEIRARLFAQEPRDDRDHPSHPGLFSGRH